MAESNEIAMLNESSSADSQGELRNIFDFDIIYLNHTKCTLLSAAIWIVDMIIIDTMKIKTS